MAYKNKKDGTIISEFYIEPSIKALMGVASMADGRFICGKGADGKIYPICWAHEANEENADEKNQQLIKRIITDDYEEVK